MKNFSEIQALLDRYWEGETTLEEEHALKAYFASGQVDEQLRSVAPFFQALREEQALQATYSSDDFESSDEFLQAKAKVVPLNPVHFAWQKLAAAATVALLLSAGWWWVNREKPVSEQIAQQPPGQPEQILTQPQQVLEENKTEIVATTKPLMLAKKTIVKRKKPAAVAPDPETEHAMEEIMAALALVSSKIKKGKQEAAKGTIHLDNMDKIFKKKSEG